jgi:hypothetical protein
VEKQLSSLSSPAISRPTGRREDALARLRLLGPVDRGRVARESGGSMSMPRIASCSMGVCAIATRPGCEPDSIVVAVSRSMARPLLCKRSAIVNASSGCGGAAEDVEYCVSVVGRLARGAVFG